jgi:hypothetical protein
MKTKTAGVASKIKRRIDKSPFFILIKYITVKVNRF